jgi:hypothetical protein
MHSSKSSVPPYHAAILFANGRQFMNASYRQRAVSHGKAARLVEPARISPAARIPGTVVSNVHGSRSRTGHRPDSSASVSVRAGIVVSGPLLYQRLSEHRRQFLRSSFGNGYEEAGSHRPHREHLPCALIARFSRSFMGSNLRAHSRNLSPNMGRPLLDCARVFSSWMMSQCSTSRPSSMRRMSAAIQFTGCPKPENRP